MRYALALLPVLAFQPLLVAAEPQVGRAAANCVRLEEARIALSKSDAPDLVERYLAAFPRTFGDYLAVFDGQAKGCEGTADHVSEHLDTLGKIQKLRAIWVMRIELSVATGAHWQADAVGMFQNFVASSAAANTKLFADELMQRTRPEMASIIRFLADVENHAAYPQYGQIISNLRSLSLPWLADEFELARETRKLEHDH